MTAMIQRPRILKLDIAGNPCEWITYEDYATYDAKGLVAWSMGEVEYDVYGGTNSKTGQRSSVTINTIAAIRGEINKKRAMRFNFVPLSSRSLFRRDWNICAYCGENFSDARLTRDHILPRSRGGEDSWMNLVTSCETCNKNKDARTPEEAGMELIYLPYEPNRAEYLIFDNRTILADQMEFLLKRVLEGSRTHVYAPQLVQ